MERRFVATDLCCSSRPDPEPARRDRPMPNRTCGSAVLSVLWSCVVLVAFLVVTWKLGERHLCVYPCCCCPVRPMLDVDGHVSHPRRVREWLADVTHFRSAPLAGAGGHMHPTTAPHDSLSLLISAPLARPFI